MPMAMCALMQVSRMPMPIHRGQDAFRVGNGVDI